MKKIKLLFSFLLIIVLTICGNLISQTEVQPNGLGTEEDPYQIATLNNLYWITLDSSRWNSYYIQTANINAVNTQNWVYKNDYGLGYGLIPIGNDETKFEGNYNGQGNKIDSLLIFISTIDNVGLFGYTYFATIDSLGLTNVYIAGKNNVGGLIGKNEYSTIRNSYTTGEVSGSSSIGGLVGYNNDNSTISESYSTVNVSGSSNFVAGFVGLNDNSSTLSNSYSTGNVNGISDVGGFLGQNNKSTVSNSYSIGRVNGTSNVGGLVGLNYKSTVNNSFYNSDSASGGAGTGKMTVEMKDFETFTYLNTTGLDSAWDFVGKPNDDNGENDYWNMSLDESINNGYPCLTWQDNTIQDTTHLKINNHIIKNFTLKQNYPNPFNPSTTISYNLLKSSFVTLSIYDISGRLVEILVNEKKEIGSHIVKWNAVQASSGIYFYRIVTNNLVITKKCILLK